MQNWLFEQGLTCEFFDKMHVVAFTLKILLKIKNSIFEQKYARYGKNIRILSAKCECRDENVFLKVVVDLIKVNSGQQYYILSNSNK